MVREAAVTVLAPAREARPIVIAATRDRSARVRARALRVLTQARDTSPEARDAVRHVLRAERERPEVAVEALRYVARTCAASLEGDVEGLLERSRQRSSDVDDPRADEAILALHALGSDAARRSLTASVPTRSSVLPSEGWKGAPRSARRWVDGRRRTELYATRATC